MFSIWQYTKQVAKEGLVSLGINQGSGEEHLRQDKPHTSTTRRHTRYIRKAANAARNTEYRRGDARRLEVTHYMIRKTAKDSYGRRSSI